MRYEEPYRRKPRASRRRQGGGCLTNLLLRLLALGLVLLLLAAGLLYALPVSLLAVEPEGVELSLTDGLPAEPANILLLGLDAPHENSRRSDTVMIASVGYGTLKLTSVLRDTVLDIPGRGPGKLNAAYAYGGPNLVARTLNENLRLNIIHYIAVDYTTLIRAVDALGGVDLALSDAEVDRVNAIIESHREGLAAQGYTAPALAPGGETTHLNGVQALCYARIRKLDSDFVRTNRQRKLLVALLERLKASLWNPFRLVRLARAVLDTAQTSLSPFQLLLLGEKALAAGPPEQLRLPVDGSYDDNGSSLAVTDLPANVGALQMFLYGTQGVRD